MLDHLRFFPCINVWVVFNEGWGQYDTERLTKWVMEYDPSRIVNNASGWTDRGVGHMYDAHQYPGPSIEPYRESPGRVMVLGEFGGLGQPVEDHLWAPERRNWGYRTYQDQEVLITEYAKLIHNLKPLKSLGLAAAIYTQTTGVEIEVNGLMTYDSKVIKMPSQLLMLLHAELFSY